MNVSLRASRFKTYKNIILTRWSTCVPLQRLCQRQAHLHLASGFAPIADRAPLGSGVVLSSHIYC